jgi:transcriptional regulator with XRE-family HTH domain
MTASTIEMPRMAPRATLVAIPSLRYWRTQLAVPQTELAARARVGINTVQRLEAGGTARLSTIARLAVALKVTPGQLMAQPPEAQT